MSTLKFLILLLFLSFSAFAQEYRIVSAPLQSEFEKTNLEPVSSTLFRSLDGDIYKYYKVNYSSGSGYYFNADTGLTGGIYKHSSGLYYVVEDEISLKTVCGHPNSFSATFPYRDCDPNLTPDSSSLFAIQARNSTHYALDMVAECRADEDYNTATGKCQKCASNESWDPDTQKCYRDCTKDGGINKFADTDGRCTDCSGEKTALSALDCLCRGTGHGSGQEYYQRNTENPALSPYDLKGRCTDGSIVDFTDPAINNKPEKPDDNKTKPDTPKPDDNKTKPDDPKPDDPGNGDKDKEKQEFCKKNPKDPSCKPTPKLDDNKTTPNGNGDKGDNLKFNEGDFNDSDLEKERSGLYDDIKNHINDNLSKFDGIRESINQFISNIQGKGFSNAQSSIKSKCPIKKQIPLPNGSSKEIVVDFCEIVSPASEISYYAFYVGFAVGGFILFLKLLIFSI